jgi:hypothetical protein
MFLSRHLLAGRNLNLDIDAMLDEYTTRLPADSLSSLSELRYDLAMKLVVRPQEFDVVVLTNENDVIEKVTILVDDSMNVLVGILNKYFGVHGTSAESSIDSVHLRSHYSWDRKGKPTVYLLKRRYMNELVGYPVTEIHYYYSNPDKHFSDDLISLKEALH